MHEGPYTSPSDPEPVRDLPRADAPPAEAERRATWFELFCDLVFVAAVGQITRRISAHPTLGSVAAAAALFVPLWWTWVLYAVRANRADRDVTSHRLLTMAGLVAVCGLAVFVGSVGTSDGADTGFALSYLGARLGVAALYALEARRDRRLVPLLRSFTIGSTVSALFWSGALLAPAGPVRYGIWAGGMAVDLAIPLLSGRRIARAPHHTEHLRERFGLFTIIVLGESVLGFTNGLVQARTAGSAMVTGAAAFALCACLWWSYFSASGTRPGAHAELASDPRLLHTYVLGHLPVQLGLAVTGGAVGTAVLGSGRHLTTALALCILGGVALFLLSTAAVRAAFTGVRDPVVRLRLATALLIAALVPAAGRAPVPAMLAAPALLLALSVTAEAPSHRRRVQSTP
ncbi:low temperature requirement protein A [Streptomyces sp. NPDC001691]|uniref:low temperature requirement protein A n=1 Tax=unclassified Streptomyces TaxID=2593676 RepID=UPI000DEBD234|nr:low temperature requirement protein A [Streptomyces sp. SDr-06]RCH61725.1 low temperature requirement protein A [Streptomyces sp. SDr-06]